MNEDIARIELSHGKFALVDASDCKWLCRWKWSARLNKKTWYAFRYPGSRKNGRTLVLMHVLIFGGTCDHKNRNGLDNRRCNLRAATLQEQNFNRGIRSDNTSGYKGVSYCSALRTKPWKARLHKGGKLIFQKNYKTKIGAAKAYNKIAIKHFGEFAVLNAV